MKKIMRRIATVHIGMKASLSAWNLLALILSACSPLPALSMLEADTHATVNGDSIMPTSFEVELDIFSGNPNPVWILSDADGALFIKKLAMLPEACPVEFSANLGYRGFIIKAVDKTKECLVRIQNGTVQLSQNETDVFYGDQNRDLERWLLNTGRPSLRSDLFKIVESEFPNNPAADSPGHHEKRI